MALENETITVYEPGTQKRDFIYIDDVVDSMILAAQSGLANGEVFLVGSGKETAFVNMVKLIIEIAGSGTWKFVPWPPERKSIEVGDIALDLGKIQKLLKWNPKVNLEEGLNRTIEYYRERMHDYL
jgi:nucleoside-diphosphate-sugar epimerase